MASECAVCVETFTKTTKQKCVCPHCSYAVCRVCIQKYILTCTDYTIQCINCKKGWTHDTVDTFITKQFRNVDLKIHRQTVLFEREKSLLPATQLDAQRVATVRTKTALLTTLNAQKKALIAQIKELHQEIYVLNNGGGKQSEEKQVFTTNCPRNNCRGFVNSSTWDCGICKHFVCKKCHECIGETKDSPHTCKEENVQTATLLKKDSKPCPSCNCFIYKISGCSQMWCTQCHTTFDWNTGRHVTKGALHNPHYYEWLKNAGNAPRNVGDVPCGGIVHIRQLLLALNVPAIAPDDKNNIVHIHQWTSHIEDITMQQYRINHETDNIELRIQYLLSDITEDQLKIKLQQNEKKRVKNREIYDVLEMYVFTMVDMFNNLVASVESKKANPREWIEQVGMLQTFANEQLEKISKRYACIVPCINYDTLSSKKYS